MRIHSFRFPGISAISFVYGLTLCLSTTGCLHTDYNQLKPIIPTNVDFPSARSVNEKLGRGVNLGNALDAPEEGAWGVTLKSEWFKAIADSGLTTVRLPIRWSAHALEIPPYTIDSVFMKRVVWAVDQALAAKLNVIIDMHHYDSLMVHPDTELKRFLSMWKQIAKRFAEYPPEVVFEILNEPRDAMDAPTWNHALARAIDTIRSLQENRAIMVGTTPWGGLSGLANLKLPPDGNLIVTVHYYDPHTFTHQGAKFETGADAWLGTKWRATPAQRAQVDQDVEFIRDWGAKHGQPIFLGEFGTYEAVDTVSRAIYTEYLATRFEKAGFSWAVWNFSSDFGITDDVTGAWHAYLVQALLRPGQNAYLDSILKASTPIDLNKYFIFEDFEDSLKDITSSALAWNEKSGKPIDSIYTTWYAYNSDSSSVNANSGERLSQWFEVDSGTAPRNFGATVGDWGFQGQGLHVKMHLKGDNYPFAGFGSGLLGGWGSSFVDLTKLTAIQFRAKGSGEWCMQVISDSISNKYSAAENWGQMNVQFRLKSEWESFVIPAEILLPKKYSVQEAQHITWEDVRDKIIALEFMNGQSYGKSPDDSLEIWLDDIKLIGVEGKDLGL